MTNAAYTHDGKPLCLDCSKPIALGELEEAQSARTWSLVKFIFSGFFIGIALIALAGGADIMQVWIVAGVAGIPTAFKASRRSREERIADEINDRLEQDLMNLLFMWAIRLLVKVVFILGLAPICAVFTCISNLVKFLGSKKRVNEAREALEYIEQCLAGGQESMPEECAPVASLASAYAPVPSVEPLPQVASCQSPKEETPVQPLHSAPASPAVPPAQPSAPAKRGSAWGIGIAVGGLVLVGVLAGYFAWYVPYAEDRDALRTYVVPNNVYLRETKAAGVEYNILSKLPYGSELITYSWDEEWAEVKVNGVKGFVASAYLLGWDDFRLLNDVWGSMDAKECIESSKCRLALLDYCKRNGLATGNKDWQLYTLQKDVKPNNVLYPRLTNGYDKFTEFAFILKNNTTGDRRFAIYSFGEESEKPIFLYDETAPKEGQIRQVRCNWGKYSVSYTGREQGNRVRFTASAPETVRVGEQFRVHYKVTSANATYFQDPVVQGFEILGGPFRSTSMVKMNGKQEDSVTHTYLLTAHDEGTFVIPPVTVNVDGRVLPSNSLRIKVLPVE